MPTKKKKVLLVVADPELNNQAEKNSLENNSQEVVKKSYLVATSLSNMKLNIGLVIDGKSLSYNLTYLQTIELPDTQEVRRQLKTYLIQNLLKLE